MRLKIRENLRTASFYPKFTSSLKKKGVIIYAYNNTSAWRLQTINKI